MHALQMKDHCIQFTSCCAEAVGVCGRRQLQPDAPAPVRMPPQGLDAHALALDVAALDMQWP